MIDPNLPRGIYVLDQACGKGKTTDIFNFICQHYKEGILYCVDSISELNKMKDALDRNLVQTGKIFADDIMTITSEQNPDARGILYDYHTHPERLITKKILLITHVRFFTSIINFFMIFRRNPNAFIFNGDIQALLTRNDLRQWIFFDETPMWIRPFSTMPRSILSAFSEDQNGGWSCKSIGKIRAIYNEFIKGTKEDPFRHGTHLDELKNKFVLSMFPRMYGTWSSQPKTEDILIYLRPIDLAVNGVQTHILFCEGAADLLLSGSPFNFIPTQGKKYNAQINFHKKIPILTNRWQGVDWEKYIASLEHVIGIIIDNMKIGKKTLVCVWKTEDCSKEDIDGSNVSPFRDKVKDYLIVRGYELGYNITGYFDAIYYGENKCKSCNDYCDYSAIILFGKWSAIESKCNEHNLNWGTNITSRKLLLWFYVQLISRIGIRRHDGGTYDVYMTDDFPDDFIGQLYHYFNNDILPIDRIPTDELEVILKDIYRQKKTISRIKNLCDTYPDLRKHIVDTDMRTPFELNISDDELKEILSYKGGHFSRAKTDFEDKLRKINVEIPPRQNFYASL